MALSLSKGKVKRCRIKFRELWMFIGNSTERVPVRLTEERWNHICRRHLELAGQEKRVLATIESPETVL